MNFVTGLRQNTCLRIYSTLNTRDNVASLIHDPPLLTKRRSVRFIGPYPLSPYLSLSRFPRRWLYLPPFLRPCLRLCQRRLPSAVFHYKFGYDLCISIDLYILSHFASQSSISILSQTKPWRWRQLLGGNQRRRAGRPPNVKHRRSK